MPASARVPVMVPVPVRTLACDIEKLPLIKPLSCTVPLFPTLLFSVPCRMSSNAPGRTSTTPSGLPASTPTLTVPPPLILSRPLPEAKFPTRMPVPWFGSVALIFHCVPAPATVVATRPVSRRRYSGC